VDEALSGERHQLWLFFAPSIEGRRPFTGAIELVALLAGRDELQ
jgi:hypothetical protein